MPGIVTYELLRQDAEAGALRLLKQASTIERLRAVEAVAREVQRGSETWYVPGDTLDRLNAALAELEKGG